MVTDQEPGSLFKDSCPSDALAVAKLQIRISVINLVGLCQYLEPCRSEAGELLSLTLLISPHFCQTQSLYIEVPIIPSSLPPAHSLHIQTSISVSYLVPPQHSPLVTIPPHTSGCSSASVIRVGSIFLSWLLLCFRTCTAA